TRGAPMQRVRIGAAICVAFAWLATTVQVQAMCSISSSFAQVSTYIESPGAYQLDGAFWGLGYSAGSCRSSNGTFPFSAWHRYFEGRPYLAGDWAQDQRISGCIQEGPNPQP